MKYITKPVEVEACPVSTILEKDADVPNWLVDAVLTKVVRVANNAERMAFGPTVVAMCKTKQGLVQCNATDMFICLEDGEIYPCSIEVLEKKYTPVQ
jgi:hypothetical protein